MEICLCEKMGKNAFNRVGTRNILLMKKYSGTKFPFTMQGKHLLCFLLTFM